MLKKTTFIILIFIAISKSSNCQWSELNNFSGKAIAKFEFIDDNLGYALANDLVSNKQVILKTIDGANSWNTILTVNFNEFMDISFVS